MRVRALYSITAAALAGCGLADPAETLSVETARETSTAAPLQKAYIKASNTGAGDSLGHSVALSADGFTLAVGAHQEDSAARGIDDGPADNSAPEAGAVYVYTHDGKAWSQQAYVKPSNTGADDRFGWSVALSADGSTLAVGAPFEDSAATDIDGDQEDDGAARSGAVYVFVRDGATWSQQAYLKAFNTDADDRFGTSLALSADGSLLAVGAPFEDGAATGIEGDHADNAASEAGAVYVFERSGAAWSQQAYVKASNTDKDDHFGISVAIAGDGALLAVGAEQEDSAATGIDGDQHDDTSANAGAVYVFERSSAAWSQQAYLKASNTGAEDRFGRVVAASADGSMLAVSAPGEASTATDLDGDEGDNSARGAGAVYLFERDGDAWSQRAYVKATNTDQGDVFGTSLALSADGALLAVGAPDEDSAATGIEGNQADNAAGSSGAIYLFERSGATWDRTTYVKASNTGVGDAFGSGVAMSFDGTTLAVSACSEDSAAVGIDGNQHDDSAWSSGAVYLFR